MAANMDSNPTDDDVEATSLGVLRTPSQSAAVTPSPSPPSPPGSIYTPSTTEKSTSSGESAPSISPEVLVLRMPPKKAPSTEDDRVEKDKDIADKEPAAAEQEPASPGQEKTNAKKASDSEPLGGRNSKSGKTPCCDPSSQTLTLTLLQWDTSLTLKN